MQPWPLATTNTHVNNVIRVLQVHYMDRDDDYLSSCTYNV